MAEPIVQLVVQVGALGLLTYLIWWTTQTGAPKLFELLSDLKVAVSSTSDRLAVLEEKVDNLAKIVEGKK